MVKHRWLMVGTVVALLAPHSAAAGGIRVNWTFNGAGLQNVAKADNRNAPDLVTGRTLIFQAEAKGSPGTATILGINQSFLPNEVAPDLEGCFEGANLKFVGGLSENSLVALFKDLSVLNMVKDGDGGFSCFEFATSRFDATVPIRFNGGFGRFESAWGTATIRLQSKPVGFIEVAPDVMAPSTLISEVGTIRGTVYVN
jgi:hypothetical protein